MKLSRRGTYIASKRSIKLNAADNVSTLLEEATAGDMVAIVLEDREQASIAALERIPFGHKMATEPIDTGAFVVKYGAAIGKSLRPIRPGEQVHVHNLAGLQGEDGE